MLWCANGCGGCGSGCGCGCGARAGAVAEAIAAEPHELATTGAEPSGDALAIGADPNGDALAIGALVTGDLVPGELDIAGELALTLLNSTGSDEIARGFANGMTFAGAGVAAPDRIDGSGAPEREPVGNGAGRAGRAERGGGTRRASTVVASPISCCRGAFGMTRSCVTGSCAM